MNALYESGDNQVLLQVTDTEIKMIEVISLPPGELAVQLPIINKLIKAIARKHDGMYAVPEENLDE